MRKRQRSAVRIVKTQIQIEEEGFINVKTEETIAEKAGTKDACYHKVKSRYKVWIQVLMRQEHWSSVVKKVQQIGATQQRKNPSQLKMHREEPMSNLST